MLVMISFAMCVRWKRKSHGKLNQTCNYGVAIIISYFLTRFNRNRQITLRKDASIWWKLRCFLKQIQLEFVCCYQNIGTYS